MFQKEVYGRIVYCMMNVMRTGKVCGVRRSHWWMNAYSSNEGYWSNGNRDVNIANKFWLYGLVLCSYLAAAAWSEWFGASAGCSVTCGTGTLQRYRFCSSGRDSDCPGNPFDAITCYNPSCWRHILCKTYVRWSFWKTNSFIWHI